MHVHSYFAISEFRTWVIIWLVLTWSTQYWPGHEQDPWWVINRHLWLMIIYGLQVSIRHIHASDGDLLWWLVLFLWLSTFTGFIIFIVPTWIGPLLYFCDGLMGYEYSFLVDLAILSPLVQLVFSFRRAHDRYWSLGFLATNLPRKNGNKAQWRKNYFLLGRYRDSWGTSSHLYHTTMVPNPSVQSFDHNFWSLIRYGMFYVAMEAF